MRRSRERTHKVHRHRSPEEPSIGGTVGNQVVIGATRLAETIEYIHWNPVKRGLVAKPEDWAWSSARWYAGLRDVDATTEIPMDPLPPKRPG